MKRLLIFLMTVCLHLIVKADVKLPKLFGDNMVLQRGKPIPVWGWANAGEKVTVTFHGQVKKTKAAKDGKWQIFLDAEAAGGPFEMSVAGKNKIIIDSILVGEVWVCSGQSNMEMWVASSKNAEEEITNGNIPEIRQFKVPPTTSATPEDDLPAGAWETASSATVGKFTAVGFFFAKKIYEELHVPIGIINTSWGGTIIETWISREALQSSNDFKDVFDKSSFADINSQNERQYEKAKQGIEAAFGTLPVHASAWDFAATAVDEKAWKKMPVPVNFNESGLANFDGFIWFRKTIILHKDDIAEGAVLNLSTIDDVDETYINGQLVGSSKSYDVMRRYNIPKEFLKEGKNTIAVRITDTGGNGGFFGQPSDLKFVCADKIIPLAGEWLFKIEALNKTPVNPNSYPSLLFNSMINPIMPYPIQGALWYQGESNASRAFQYRNAFPLLIKDWRTRFKQGDFPFYFVQLASYSAENGNSKNGSSWAELRESQTKTLALPNTGMAVTLDIGETNDIHPKDKQDVGLRLAAIALHDTYKKNISFAGPAFESMQISGNKAVLSFANINSGYLIKDKYKYIKGFEIAGADKIFYYAQASLEDNKVIVYSDSVTTPAAIRYGWADDAPEANLYSKDGFPAVPFRTDNWNLLTADNKYKVE